MNDQNTFFVLLVQFNKDPSDPPPSEIWTFRHPVEAEDFLRRWSHDFLGSYTHEVDDLPLPDNELMAAFHSAGADVRLYQCCLDDDSYELTLFAHALEVAS